MVFHLGKRFSHPLGTEGGPPLGGERSKKRELSCYSLIQEMFIECLLCARNCSQLLKKKKDKNLSIQGAYILVGRGWRWEWWTR